MSVSLLNFNLSDSKKEFWLKYNLIKEDITKNLLTKWIFDAISIAANIFIATHFDLSNNFFDLDQCFLLILKLIVLRIIVFLT